MNTKTNLPEKADLLSMDMSHDNRKKLKVLFPSVFTEIKNEKGEIVESIDFEKLKAELGTFSDVFENRRERYGMDWPGKRDCHKIIQQPSVATLKPRREESVNFDTTENLFIEGDNLEVLKLLQKSYYGKIKMIYIDPPYNTGKEFIYPDKYSESLDTYLDYAGLVDGEGKKFSSNTTSEGRFHTKWLNMMYPRLYLAKNLLSEDGVIFISIDDNELSNLRKLCDEIFGEELFAGTFPWRSRTAKADVPFGVSSDVEWVVAYAKSSFIAGRFGQRKYFKSADFDDRWRLQDLTKNTTREERPNSYFTMINPKGGDSYPASETRTWSVTKETFKEYYAKGKIVFPGDYEFLSIKKPAFRVFENEDKQKAIEKYGSDEVKMSISTYLPEKDVGRTEHGSKEIRELFNSQVFSYPKPSSLINFFVECICDSEAIILDFFAGSGTTADSVMQINAKDGGNRKFILVQLPEPLDPQKKEQATAAKYCLQHNLPLRLTELTKERIRKNIIRHSLKKTNLQNAGFKVFKLDTSNFHRWSGDTKSSDTNRLIQQLEFQINHIDSKADQKTILFEILLKSGFKLCEKIDKLKVEDIGVFSVADGALLICLEKKLNQKFIEGIADLEPIQFICLDSAFGNNDQLKANAVQTFAARNQGKTKAQQINFRTV